MQKSRTAKPGELFYPRGLEAYVPALASIRESCWTRLPGDVQTVLEVADYVGLERAIEASRAVELRSVLPGPLLSRYADLAIRSRLTIGDILDAIAKSLADEVSK